MNFGRKLSPRHELTSGCKAVVLANNNVPCGSNRDALEIAS